MDFTQRLARIVTALASGALAAPAFAQTDPTADILAQLQVLRSRVETVLDQQMVPFVAQAHGGLCDSGPSPSSNPAIIIEGTGTHNFTINSILLRSAPQPFGQEGYSYFIVSGLVVDGTAFDMSTGNIFAPVSGWGVQESADLMGMPVSIAAAAPLTSTPRTAPAAGANFPHQIVATSAGTYDVFITFLCRSDTWPFSIDSVRVSGWKSPRDTVSVTYYPGS
jgi:hypothetical protein